MQDDFPFNHFINFNQENTKKPNNNKTIEEYTFPEVQQSNENFSPNLTLEDDSFHPGELEMLTEELLDNLKNSISPQKYKAYLESTLSITELNNNYLTLSVSTNFIKNMIEKYYVSSIKQIIFKTLGTSYDLKIEVQGAMKLDKESGPFNSIDSIMKNAFDEPNSAEPTKKLSAETYSFKLNNALSSTENIKEEVESAEIKYTNANQKNRKFDLSKTFDNFIVGPSNNMAYAFTQAVAKDPGKVYPQLYIHGNSGLGKTHLLHALCNEITENRPYMRICFTTANEFMSEMVMAIQSTTGRDNKINEFRRKYTELVDILIIDDIHELKNRARTQSEFFHIFNELQNKGKQLVFTSDKPPKEIVGIEDRIRTRLSSALLIDIQQPDLETRIAILKKKSIEKDIFLDDEVINLIATCIKSNVRELEGKLIKLGAYSDLMNVDIDLEIAKEQLNLTELLDEKILTIESIAKTIAAYYKIALGDIKGKSRKKEVALARHIAMYMSHKILKKTLEDIGEYFDNRDHSTVIHGIKKVQNLLKEDVKIAQNIFEIETKL